MSAWDKFMKWLQNGSQDPDDTYYVESATGIGVDEADKALELKLLMMNSALGYLAAALSMCRWRVIRSGVEVADREYFRLNSCPNRSQNKMQFCSELVYRLAFYNEALIISPKAGDDSLWIADSWSAEDHGQAGVIYRNVHIENDERTYTLKDSEVLHIKLNWRGLYPLLAQAATDYETMIGYAVTGYAKQAGERGILEISSVASGTPEQQAAFIKSLEDRFSRYFKSNNAVLPLQAGNKYTMNSTAHRNTSEINDVINLTNEFAERVALALRVPVALMKGNVENTSHARTDLILYGVKPIATQIEQEYNMKRLGMDEMVRGSRLYIDPVTINLTNPEDMATFCEKMVSCGQYSVDELRNLRGEPLLGTPEAQIHYITKNYGFLGSDNDDGTQDVQQDAVREAEKEGETT